MVNFIRQYKLKKFVQNAHAGQKRKYTGLPYYVHLKAVAKMASHVKYGWEVGLCHDLLEDTKVSSSKLVRKLFSIGYSQVESSLITGAVIELTDQYTKGNYPDLNRAARKEKECERLSKISYLAQSVKYADLIDNLLDISKNDVNFAKVYESEKLQLLGKMEGGCQILRHQAYIALSIKEKPHHEKIRKHF